MYDYKKDDEQLSKENSVGEFFAGGGNTSSDFKIRKENLPGWAVDWARNRFNMDAKNVKFYVMDEQEVDNSVALASGDSIFVTSDHKSDETIIKHELTHIYQQAIGTATESNAGDTSLEDEAVQTSEEGETLLDKGKTQSGGYILPREKTNVVQSLGALAIAGIVLGGAALVAAGIAGGITWLTKKIKNKKIMSENENQIVTRTNVPIKTVKNIVKIFSWCKEEEKYWEYIEKLCNFSKNPMITIDDLKQESKDLKKLCEMSNNTVDEIMQFGFYKLQQKCCDSTISSESTVLISDLDNDTRNILGSSLIEEVNLKRNTELDDISNISKRKDIIEIADKEDSIDWSSIDLLSDHGTEKVEKEESSTKEKVQDSEEAETSSESVSAASDEKEESSTKEDVRNSGEAETSSENVSAASDEKEESSTKEDVQNFEEVKTSSENVSAANVQKKGLPSKISDWGKKHISKLVHDIAEGFRDHGFGYIPYFRLQEFANILNIKVNYYQFNTLVRISRSCDLLDNKLNKLREYTEQIINSNEEYKKQKQSGNWDYRPLESFLMNLYRKITPERYSSPKLKEFAKVLKIKPGTPQWNVLRTCGEKCDKFKYIPIYEIETYVNYYIKSNPEYERKNYNWEVSDVAYIVMEVDNMIKSGFAIDDSNESRLNKFAKILNIKSNIWCDLLETQEFMEDVPIDKIEEYANQVLDSNIEYKKRKEKGNWDNESLRSFMKDCREMVRKEIGSPRVQAFAKLFEIEPGTHQWEYLLESERETDCFDKIPIEEINEDYMKQFVKSYKKKLLGIDKIEENLGKAANVEEVKRFSENVNAAPVQKKGFPPKISDWTKEDVYKLLDNIINEVVYENSAISFFKLKEFADELGIKPNDKPWNFLVEYYHVFSMFSQFKVDELKECAGLMINSRKKYERLKLSGNWDDESLQSFIMALNNKIYTENGSPKVQKFAEALKIQRGSSSSQWKVLLQAEEEHHNDFRNIPINRIKKHTEWYIKSTPGYKNKNYNWNDSDIFNIISNVCNRIINDVGIGDDPKLQKFAEVLEIDENTSQWNALVATQSHMQYIPIDKIEEYSNRVINSNVEFKKYKQSGIWDSQVLAEFIYEVNEEIKEDMGSPRVRKFAKVLRIGQGTDQWDYLLEYERKYSAFEKIPIDVITDYTKQFVTLQNGIK